MTNTNLQLNGLNESVNNWKNDKKIKRLSYAASFGVDVWEFNKKQEKVCRKLLQLFDAVSVREISGVKLCEKHLNYSQKSDRPNKNQEKAEEKFREFLEVDGDG